MPEAQKKKIPQHVAIVIDGNRRWTTERNLSIADGQKRAWDKIISSFDWFFLRRVKVVSYNVFPAEHWQRDEEENKNFFLAMQKAFTDNLEEFNKKDFKIIFSGRLFELDSELQEFCSQIEQATRNNQSGLANICLNYDGRCELMDAIKKIIRNNLTEEQIHEGIIKKYLYTQLPNPDIILRVGGLQHTGGFILWQSTESEIIFLKKCWPDFEEFDVMKIIEEYNERTQS